MRHVSQETVSLLREIEQALAQPLELASEPLEIQRARDGIGRKKRAAAQFVDRAVDLPQRPADAQREHQDRGERERNQQRGFPEQLALGRCVRTRRAASSASICALVRSDSCVARDLPPCWRNRLAPVESGRTAGRASTRVAGLALQRGEFAERARARSERNWVRVGHHGAPARSSLWR